VCLSSFIPFSLKRPLTFSLRLTDDSRTPCFRRQPIVQRSSAAGATCKPVFITFSLFLNSVSLAQLESRRKRVKLPENRSVRSSGSCTLLTSVVVEPLSSRRPLAFSSPSHCCPILFAAIRRRSSMSYYGPECTLLLPSSTCRAASTFSPCLSSPIPPTDPPQRPPLAYTRSSMQASPYGVRPTLSFPTSPTLTDERRR
jgi:hypothetical protein